jgi:chaperonin GroEL
LRSARRLVADEDNNKITGELGGKTLSEPRKKQLRQQIDKTTSDCDRYKLKERLGKLVGGVAVIGVGATSESEMNSRKEAIDDAVIST